MTPPTFFKILMFLRSTLSADLGSIVLRTESTAMGANFGSCDTIFEDRDVDAALSNVARSVRAMGLEMS